MGRSHFHLFPPWFPWRWSRAALPLRLIHQKIITLLPLGVLLWTLPSDELALGSRNPTGRSCWNLSEIVVFGNKILNIFQWCQKKSTVQRHRQTSRMIWGTSPSLWKLPKVSKDTEMARSENAEVLQIHYSKSDCWKIICFCWCQSSYLGYLDVFWVAFLLTSHPCDMISKGWHLNTQTRLVIYIYIIYIYTWFAKNVTSGWFDKFFGLSSALPKAPGAREGGSGVIVTWGVFSSWKWMTEKSTRLRP